MGTHREAQSIYAVSAGNPYSGGCVTNKHGNGISQTVSVEERDGACQCMKSIFLHRKQDHETGKAAAGGK